MAANLTSLASPSSLAAATAVASSAAEGFLSSVVWPPSGPLYVLASLSSNAHDSVPGHKALRGHQHPPLAPAPSSSSDGQQHDSFNGMFQLLLLSLVATGGTMGSIFVISAITVIDTFQVRGNAFLASFALGHLLVTVIVLPASVVTIMAGVPNEPTVCHYQWLFTLATLIISVLSLAFMALENFKGLSSVVNYDLCCTKFRIVSFALTIWMASGSLVVAQHFHAWGPNLCPHLRKQGIWLSYHASLGAGLILLPTLISIYYFTRAVFRIKAYRLQMSENPQSAIYFLTDEGLLNSNVAVYALFLLMWTPLCVVAVISVNRPVAQHVLDTCWWLAIANSCGYSFLYAFTNRDFGEAFFKLFYYCCCKSHVSFARKGTGFNVMATRGPIGGAAMNQPPGSAASGRTHAGFGMVALGHGAGISGGGMMGGGPFRAFRGSNRQSDL